MNICLILGLLCLVYGLIVAIAGSGGTKFFIVWIGIAVILFALAGLLHMGMWDRIPQIVRWIFGILCGIFFLSFLVSPDLFRPVSRNTESDQRQEVRQGNKLVV